MSENDNTASHPETGVAHFDAVLTDDERSPAEFKKIKGVGAVLVDPNIGRLVLTGRPGEPHNCDLRGCGSVEHKIAEFDVEKTLFEPIRVHLEDENQSPICEDCGDRLASTLSSDSHPDGPNLLICEECAL